MSGRVLLDTNIIIGLFANDPSIVARLSEVDAAYLPSVALGELYFGAYKSGHPEQNVRRIEQLIAMSAVLSCDAGTASCYGKIKHALRQMGKPIPENDIWIAALADQHGLALISRDVHFQQIEPLLSG